MSPMQRSLAYLREHGYDPVRKVEHWNPFSKHREDLWGFDIAAVSKLGLMTLIQVTDDSHFAEHLKHLLALPTTRYLRPAATLVIHSWGKKGARGKRKVWTLREEWL